MDRETILTRRMERREARERFLAGRRAEKQYAVQLRQVARHIGDVVRGIAPDGIVSDLGVLFDALDQYALMLRPWAQSVAGRMIADVGRRDAAAWSEHGKIIGQALRKEIESAPTGVSMRARLAEQVKLITSLPLEAAERVHRFNHRGHHERKTRVGHRQGDHGVRRCRKEPGKPDCPHRGEPHGHRSDHREGQVHRLHTLHVGDIERRRRAPIA